MKRRSHLEQRFELVIRDYQLPEPIREFNFHGFRFDFAWPVIKLALEIDGGTFMKQGGHACGVRYQKDCTKNNIAQLNGWAVLRADSKMVNEPEFAEHVKEMIRRRILWKKYGTMPY